MKKVSWIVVIAGAVVGLAAVVLTHLGNPANMGFCIACFLRDITGAVGMHGAAKVQYVRPEIIGLVLGAFIMSVATKEFRAKAGSSPATRFVLGAFVMIGALAFLGCPLRMVLRIGGGDLNAVVGLVGFTLGIFIGIQFLKRGFSLKRAYPVGKGEGGVLPIVMTGLLILVIAVTLTLMSVSDRLLAYAVANFQLPPFVARLWGQLRFPVAAVAGYFALFFLYALSQDGRQPWRNIWPGTLAALAAWL